MDTGARLRSYLNRRMHGTHSQQTQRLHQSNFNARNGDLWSWPWVHFLSKISLWAESYRNGESITSYYDANVWYIHYSTGDGLNSKYRYRLVDKNIFQQAKDAAVDAPNSCPVEVIRRFLVAMDVCILHGFDRGCSIMGCAKAERPLQCIAHCDDASGHAVLNYFLVVSSCNFLNVGPKNLKH